ncbi:unnamed protein product, partial [Aureobasidium vineae]
AFIRVSITMKLGVAFLAFSLAILVRGQQNVGPDGVITVSSANCTAVGTQTYAYADPSGIAYRYICGASANGNAVTQISVSNWTGCFAACDNYANCTGFTYNAGANLGAGTGNCAIKTVNPNTFSNTASANLVATRIAAVMQRYVPYIPNFSCPAQNNQVVTDLSGVPYLIGCGNDSNGAAVTILQAPNNFDDCFSSCDAYTATVAPTNCNLFVYVGGSSGVGPGNCYLKSATTGSFANGVTNNVAAIRLISHSSRLNDPVADFFFIFIISVDPAVTATTSTSTDTSSLECFIVRIVLRIGFRRTSYSSLDIVQQRFLLIIVVLIIFSFKRVVIKIIRYLVFSKFGLGSLIWKQFVIKFKQLFILASRHRSRPRYRLHTLRGVGKLGLSNLIQRFFQQFLVVLVSIEQSIFFEFIKLVLFGIVVGVFSFEHSNSGSGQSVGPDGITTVATATCTTTGTQIYAYTDTSSVVYQYMCGGGAGGGNYGSIPTSNVVSWQDCFHYCDTYVDANGFSNCTGFTYNQGAAYGNGPGQCLLKSGGPQNFATTAVLLSTRIAGINSRYVAGMC